MAGFTVNISGLAELDQRLKEMGNEKAKKAIRKALKAGAKVVQAAIQERTPVRPDLPSSTALPPGAMATDIQIASITEDDNLAVMIGPGKHTARQARWVEYGHRMVTGGRSTETKPGSGKYRGSGTEVSQVAPAPFIRPAYEASREAATEAIVTTLAKEIEKSAPKS